MKFSKLISLIGLAGCLALAGCSKEGNSDSKVDISDVSTTSTDNGVDSEIITPDGTMDSYRMCESAEAWAELLLASADFTGTEKLTDKNKISEIFGVDIEDCADAVFYYNPDEASIVKFAFIMPNADSSRKVSMGLSSKLEELWENTTLSPEQQESADHADLGTMPDGYISYIVHPQGMEIAQQLLIEPTKEAQ